MGCDGDCLLQVIQERGEMLSSFPGQVLQQLSPSVGFWWCVGFAEAGGGSAAGVCAVAFAGCLL